MKFQKLDKIFISEMHHWSIPILRYALAAVFLWFGLLKVFNVSPVFNLVAEIYYFFPKETFPIFFFILGVWEVLIGFGLFFNKALRLTIALLWLQMLGTLLAPVFHPVIFFTNNNLLMLTVEGEFVAKNLVLIAASLVIAGYTIHPMSKQTK